MKISYDTDSGVLSTSYSDYVSGLDVHASLNCICSRGGLEQGAIYVSGLDVDASLNRICSPGGLEQGAIFLQQGVDTLHDRLHEVYSIIDNLKGKVVKKGVRKALLSLEQCLAQVYQSSQIFDLECSCGECGPDGQLELESEIEEISALLLMKGREIREILVIKAVRFNPGSEMFIFFGVEGIETPLLMLEVLFDR